MNTFDTLKRLTDVMGVAGNEKEAAQVALELLRDYNCVAHIDCHGSVVGFIGERDSNKPTVMLDAHIDQIGLIVTHIDDKGFLKAEPCGGIDRRTLSAQAVTIHTQSGEAVKGIICTQPPHVQKKGESDKAVKSDSIRIDIGCKSDVALGDVITIDGELTLMLNQIVSGPALDNRAGVCAVLYALSLLKNDTNASATSIAKVNIAVSFSVQEELGCRGAAVTAYNIEPEYAIVVDVSYGMSPGCSSVEHKCGKLGKGPMIGYAPALNREMFEGLKKTAQEWDIPYQTEIINGDTGGTNADKISIVKGGVKTALVSVPLRYMHTPIETADLSDIESVGRLIAAYVEQLT